MTDSWHVDYLKSSHVDSKVNDEFLQWVEDMNCSIGEVKNTQEKVHKYLGMKLDYTVL